MPAAHEWLPCFCSLIHSSIHRSTELGPATIMVVLVVRVGTSRLGRRVFRSWQITFPMGKSPEWRGLDVAFPSRFAMVAKDHIRASSLGKLSAGIGKPCERGGSCRLGQPGLRARTTVTATPDTLHVGGTENFDFEQLLFAKLAKIICETLQSAGSCASVASVAATALLAALGYLCSSFPYSLLLEGVSVVPNKPRMGTGRWELSVTRREQWLWPGHSLARSLARSPTGSITVFFTPCPYIRSCPSLPLCLLHSPSLSLVQSIPFRRFCALPP